MIKISSKELEKEGWVSFELFQNRIMMSQEEVDELALDAYKWALKLNVDKLKNNKAFMDRVEAAKKRRKNNV